MLDPSAFEFGCSGNPFGFLSALFAQAMRRKFARPKVGAPQEFENVRLIQLGVAMWYNQLLMHLRIFGPVHVAVHVMNGMVAIVACDPVDHWTCEVPGGIHIHFGTFVLSKNQCPPPHHAAACSSVTHIWLLTFVGQFTCAKCNPIIILSQMQPDFDKDYSLTKTSSNMFQLLHYIIFQ